MKNREENPTTNKSNSNRVLVYRIDALRRPFISTMFGVLSRPHDWSVFGIDAWHAEIERRKSIHALMTEDEREFFDKYCRLRDE
jgi:hypothetical protein